MKKSIIAVAICAICSGIVTTAANAAVSYTPDYSNTTDQITGIDLIQDQNIEPLADAINQNSTAISDNASAITAETTNRNNADGILAAATQQNTALIQTNKTSIDSLNATTTDQGRVLSGVTSQVNTSQNNISVLQSTTAQQGTDIQTNKTRID